MTRIAMLLVAIGACARPLEPGETRCTSREGAFGTVDTKCRTGQTPSTTGWWCTSRSDEFGLCFRAPAQCENWRFGQNAREKVYAACAQQTQALCARDACYPTPAACVYVERNSGRDPNACVATQ